MKKIKDKIASVVYRIVLIIVKLIPSRDGQDHVLIIKTDEIGDYILFRCYLKYFKKTEQYKSHKITLIGNSAWRGIFEAYDKDTVDEVIWLDKKRFKKDLFYRFSMLRKIRGLHASDVINCIFSRSLLLDDGFAFVAKGTNKIAMRGDSTNRQFESENTDSSIYTKIIDAGDQSVFDAVRNRNFVSEILQTDIKAEIRIEIKPFINRIRNKYYVMFLGAGNPERKWPLKHFLEVANYLHLKYGSVPIICGGPDDKESAEMFIKEYNKEAINYTGKTSLMQLIELLSKAEFLICVDTGVLHIAAAVDCPVIGLYSGKFYGRFAPYPKEITDNFYAVYPDFVDDLIANKDPVLYDTFKMRNDTIKMIAPEKAIRFTDKVMNK